MKFRSAIIFKIVLLISTSIQAQYYNTGQDPANLKWLQIKTDKFRIIYPEIYGSGGIEFARSLERAYSDISPLYNTGKVRIPVIIHNFTTQSNGHVAWAPKRMEIYPTPEQNSIPLDNNTQLALHELTHVMQMESLNRGFTKVMSVLLGQQMPGAVAALLPLWYMEGDAVYNETIFSGSGRGRSAAFQKELKAISVEKGQMYKYDIMVNDSYRNYIPDHYQSGYQMLAWSRRNYDPQLWNKVLKLSANAPFTINPVNFSLRSNAGITKEGLFNETFDTLTKIWKEEISLTDAETFEMINPPKKKKYINYYSPVKVDDNKFIAVKTSLTDPPALVLIDAADKSEVKIQSPGSMYPYVLSAAKGILVWIESQPDPRWNNRNYSVIKLMDTRDRSIKQLSRRSRYMSAAISPDGITIAATENSTDNKNSLVLLNVNTGKVVRSIPVPDNAYLQRARWSDDGTKICMISLTNKGEGIVSFNLADQSWEKLISESPEDYQSAFLRHDSLFFISSKSGTENIYILTPDKKIRKITNSKFGAIDPIPDGSRIYFSDYSSSGNNLCFTDIQKDIPDKSSESNSSFFIINEIKPPLKTNETEPLKTYVPIKYKKWQHLFGFHSWMPFYADIEEVQAHLTAVRPGFTLMSQNQLSTLTSSIGYEYSDRLHKFHSQIIWEGWYPVYEAQIDYGNRPVINKPDASTGDPVTTDPGIYFTNTLSLPLRFSTGKFHQFLQPSLSAIYHNNYIYVNEESRYDYGQTQVSGRFYFFNYHTSSYRDIYPRWAQIADLNLSFYPNDKDFYGPLTTLRTAFYFPGFIPNNAFRIRYEYEFQTTSKFLRTNRANLPRGYKNIISEKLSYASVDYVSPLFYPDFNLGSLLYLKRIRSGLFYDFARGTNNYYLKALETGGSGIDHVNRFTESFSSFGVELIADFHILRIPYMVSAGAQAAWVKGTTTPKVEAIFSIDIYGMIIGRSKRL
jgi:hypothetical protein